MSAPSPPLDLVAITEGLRGGRATDPWMGSWLPATWQAPEAFAARALAFLGTRRGAPCKSHPAHGVDLYHDLVAAHLGHRRTALLARGESGAWQRVSYEALHARCSGLAAAWASRPVEAGQVVAVALPPGVEATVALLTAWRLGLAVSVVPPRGPAFVRRALDRVEPDWVVAPGRLGRLAVASLPLEPGRGPAPAGSLPFKAGEPAARLLATHGAAAPGAVEVEAAVLFEGAVRDALFVYGLDEGQVLAAPGFEPMQHALGLLLPTLVAGAALALVTESDLVAEPALLTTLGATVIGVHRHERDRRLAAGGALPPGARWFRSLTDLTEPSRWEDFARTIPDRKQPGFSVVGSSASGGAALFSPPASGPPSLHLWPVPGLRWRLEEVGGPGVPSLNGTGVLAVERGEQADPAAPRAILAPRTGGLVYGGGLDIGPDGRPYLDADVEATAEALPGVRHAAALVTPGRWLNDARTVLLLFVEPGSAAPSLAEADAHLRRELGPELAPDRIELLPLRPRLRDGQVDRAWCRSQYLTGVLGRKARSPVFQRLARLGYALARPPEPRLE